jgi:hypothetical protein
MDVAGGQNCAVPETLTFVFSRCRLLTCDVYCLPTHHNGICCRLIHDRELSLFDGRRLLRHDRYDEIKTSNNFTENEMKDRFVLRYSHLLFL